MKTSTKCLLGQHKSTLHAVGCIENDCTCSCHHEAEVSEARRHLSRSHSICQQCGDHEVGETWNVKLNRSKAVDGKNFDDLWREYNERSNWHPSYPKERS